MTARVPSQAPLASLTVPSFSCQTDKLSVKNHADKTYSERSDVEEILDSKSTANDLLHLGEIHPVNANQAALIIIRLSRIVAEKKLEPGSILKDARFQHLLQVVQKQVSAMALG